MSPNDDVISKHHVYLPIQRERKTPYIFTIIYKFIHLYVYEGKVQPRTGHEGTKREKGTGLLLK
jgi:hypothetical protein